jgi:aspartate/methionine/tyrosine aminotransferase
MHICMTYLDEGDVALVPDPGYPTYSAAVKLAGGTVRTYTLRESLNWHPDLAELEKSDLSRVKLLFANYPHMPSGTLPEAAFFEKLVGFARKHDLLIVHDNPYSFILNEKPLSLLSIPGAREVVLELNSLSKSQNMAGWRIGMLCAAPERIEEVLRFKSNMDSGMFLPIQLAAAKALSLGKEWYEQVNAVYCSRRELAFALLDLLHCNYSRDQVGMFVWARIPDHFESGYTLSDAVLQQGAVFITPGGIFGNAGHRYIRVSLCATEAKFRESMERVRKFSL